MCKEKTMLQTEDTLYSDVCQIIDGARTRIATLLNTEVCMTNWYVGKRIKEDILYNQRAEYGKQVVLNLSVKLIQRYGNGWSEKKLRHCIRSAETFSYDDIVSATQRQLTWTHLKSLMYVKDPVERRATVCLYCPTTSATVSPRTAYTPISTTVSAHRTASMR